MKRHFKKPPGSLERLRVMYEKRAWASEGLDLEVEKRPLDRTALVRWMETLNRIDNEIITLEYRESLFSYDFKKRL